VIAFFSLAPNAEVGRISAGLRRLATSTKQSGVTESLIVIDQIGLDIRESLKRFLAIPGRWKPLAPSRLGI
jgi:hypothetical protein